MTPRKCGEGLKKWRLLQPRWNGFVTVDSRLLASTLWMSPSHVAGPRCTLRANRGSSIGVAMKRRKNMRLIGAGFVVAAALSGLLAAGPANAADGWARTLQCGTNYRCAMSSTTSGSVSYYVDGVLKISWGTGGAHSWNGAISGGSHTASMATTGTFSAHNASCYCPAGSSCGV